MRNRTHRGIAFEVWNGQQTWFWYVGNLHRGGGAIGAAATEADAMREACSSIDEMPAPRRAHTPGIRVIAASFRRSSPITLDVVGWDASLAKLARYLHCSSCTGA